MLGWSVLFLVVTVTAAVMGFGGVVTVTAGVAQILFFVFLVLFVATLVVRIADGADRD